MEILVEIIIELVLEVLMDLLLTFGWEGISHAARGGRRQNPILAGLAYAVFGIVLGGLSVWFLPDRLFPPPRYPGMSLVLSPLLTGTVMKLYGDSRRDHGHPTTLLATFWGGATFAFSIALARFLTL